MTYWRFLLYNVVGGIVWIGIFVYAGYFFGNIPVVKRNFTLVIFAHHLSLGLTGGDRVLQGDTTPGAYPDALNHSNQ